MIYNAKMDSALVKQRERIAKLIELGESSMAKMLLDFCQDSWEAADWGFWHDRLTAMIKEKDTIT